MATFNEPDFLGLAPFTWARGKDARDVYRRLIDNLPGKPYVTDKAKAKVMIFRFSDTVDEIEVDDFGGFTYRPFEGKPKEDCECRLVWEGTASEKISAIPQFPIDDLKPKG